MKTGNSRADDNTAAQADSSSVAIPYTQLANDEEDTHTVNSPYSYALKDKPEDEAFLNRVECDHPEQPSQRSLQP